MATVAPDGASLRFCVSARVPLADRSPSPGPGHLRGQRDFGQACGGRAIGRDDRRALELVRAIDVEQLRVAILHTDARIRCLGIAARLAERSVGHECVSPCRSVGLPYT